MKLQYSSLSYATKEHRGTTKNDILMQEKKRLEEVIPKSYQRGAKTRSLY